MFLHQLFLPLYCKISSYTTSTCKCCLEYVQSWNVFVIPDDVTQTSQSACGLSFHSRCAPYSFLSKPYRMFNRLGLAWSMFVTRGLCFSICFKFCLVNVLNRSSQIEVKNFDSGANVSLFAKRSRFAQKTLRNE